MSESPETRPFQVLVVEDSQVYGARYRKALASLGWSYEILSDGAEAWQRLQMRRPQVLLLDWNLPGMDGPTICRNLRRQEGRNYVFVILVTSNDRLEHVVAGFDAGADDYMTKPFEAAVLQAKVRVGLRISELEQRVERKVELLAEANAKQSALIASLQEKNRLVSQRTEELRETQRQLLETAHRAGMAEVATSVLHNVGNLLNTAATSSAVISEVVGCSRLATFGRILDLLDANAAHLPAFVEGDPRGQRVVEFLHEVHAVLGLERQTIEGKLRSLVESHDQIRQIIALQQTVAGVVGVRDSIAIPALIDDASKLFVDSFKRHDIDLVSDYAPDIPEITIEKSKALQILLNLLRNARDAVSVMARDNRQVRIQVTRPSADQVAIAVADNGVGIGPEHMKRMFNFGFTTKADGHGFGLHGCANLAREMGGTLSAKSDGEGCGATFTLTLPRT
jgi:two-component system sensor histidine kinase ChiS